MMTPIMMGILAGLVVALGLATWRAPRLTSTLLWALIAATMIISALMMNMPGELSNNLIGMALLYPLIWVALQFWCYWDRSKWRVAGGHIAVCALSAVVILVSTPLR